MSLSINLDAVERRIFRTAATQDGLLDIQLGLIVGALPFNALMVRVDLPEVVIWTLWAIYMLIMLPGLDMVRRHVIVPRRGVVRFRPERKQHLRRVFWITLGITLLIEAGMFTIGLAGISHSGYVPLTAFSLVYLIVGGVIAYVVYQPRILAYGILTAVAPFVGVALHNKLGSGLYVSFIPAGLMIVTGLILFAQFLQRYPRVDHD